MSSGAPEQSWDEAAEDLMAGAEVEQRELIATAEHHGQRADKVLAQGVSEFSRSYLQQLLADGAVTLNGKRLLKPSGKVAVGDLLLSLPALERNQLVLPFVQAVKTGDSYWLVWPKGSPRRQNIALLAAFLAARVPTAVPPHVTLLAQV